VSSFFVLYLAVLGSVAFIGFWNYAKLSGPFRMLVWIVTYSFFSEAATRLQYFEGDTFPIYWFYTLVTCPLYLISISYILKSKIRKLILRILMVFFLTISAFFFLTSDLHTVFPSKYVLSITTLLVIGVLTLFFDLLKREESVKLQESREFLFGSSLLVYRCITFMHLSLYDYFVDGSISPWVSIWIHSIATILYYSFLGYIFVLDSKRGKLQCST
jgi:hypothetical protein